VTVGVSAPTTAAVVAHVEQAAEAGAYGVMCLPPTTYDATERELLAFFATVCATSDLPVMLYNNPEASRMDLRADLIASVGGITAVKECSGDARRIARLVSEAGDRLEVLVGGDDWALEGFAAGATGWISGVAVAAPEACHELYERATGGDLAGARAVYERLLPLARLDMTPKLVQFFKAAQDALGYDGGPCRAPRLALSDADRAVLDTALASLAEAPAAV
jgi:4-hydroxy-tetrahydrodipicolinate synthase